MLLFHVCFCSWECVVGGLKFTNHRGCGNRRWDGDIDRSVKKQTIWTMRRPDVRSKCCISLKLLVCSERNKTENENVEGFGEIRSPHLCWCIYHHLVTCKHHTRTHNAVHEMQPAVDSFLMYIMPNLTETLTIEWTKSVHSIAKLNREAKLCKKKKLTN